MIAVLVVVMEEVLFNNIIAIIWLQGVHLPAILSIQQTCVYHVELKSEGSCLACNHQAPTNLPKNYQNFW